MIAHAIVMKLTALLVDPIDSEVRVVYLLCQIRKLLEHVPAHQRPFALNMYCHWALHVDLDGKDTVASFLQQVDDYVQGLLVGPEDLGASNRMVREFLSLDTLRSQLRDFCLSKGIRTDLTDDDARWNDFVQHYAGVIEHGSLKIRSQNHRMRHVKQVTFHEGRSRSRRVCADSPRYGLAYRAPRWTLYRCGRQRQTCYERCWPNGRVGHSFEGHRGDPGIRWPCYSCTVGDGSGFYGSAVDERRRELARGYRQAFAGKVA